jgi:prepilin-type N-terminal cleavage/methylation domain-containing protein
MSTKIKLRTKVMARSRRALAFMTSQHSPSNMTPKKSHKQQGFTLIELLVVVSILASLAGLASVAMDGYQQDSEETITRVEMQRIANAIRRFKADTGYWPKTETENGSEFGANNDIIDYAGTDSANFNFLFNKPDEDMSNWNPEYAIGWHGPYVDLPAIKPLVIDAGSAGCPITNTNDYDALQLLPRFNGLVDRFQQLRKKVSGKDYCVLTREKKDPTKFKVAEYSASPYLYETGFTDPDSTLCDSDDSVSCIALRSFGSDGVDNKGADASDDIVFVLQINP